jgi:DNA-binding LytR/AlgR family response regulator
MEKIRVTIAEDEFVIAEDISSRLETNGYEVLSVFDKAEIALPLILSDLPDILLVDIRLLGEMDGIELVKRVSEKAKVPVIYITANSDSATYEKAKATNPHSFLIKPFTPGNLLAAIDLALHNFNAGRSPVEISRTVPSSELTNESVVIHQNMFVRTNGKYKKIAAHDLLFIEASGSYVNVQTFNERHTLTQNLTQFQRKTPLPCLVRIHRSYMVNVDKIESFDDSFVFLQGHKLPLGEQFKGEFLRKVHLL